MADRSNQFVTLFETGADVLTREELVKVQLQNLNVLLSRIFIFTASGIPTTVFSCLFKEKQTTEFKKNYLGEGGGGGWGKERGFVGGFFVCHVLAL